MFKRSKKAALEEGHTNNIWNKHDFTMCGLGEKSRLWATMKHLGRCVKWSKQRIVRGYADSDIWNMYGYLQTLLPDMLEYLKNHRSGSPGYLGENYTNEDGILVNDTCHEAWDRILDRMIFLWRETDEETCSKKNSYEDEYMKALDEFTEQYGILGEKLPLVKMDFCDAAAADKLFSDNKIDAVIHFAAFKAVGESVAKPLMYYKNNLESFMNVLEAAQAHGCKNVLFSSSATVYGEPDAVPVTEQSPRKPATSPYGNTKQMCEDILQDSVRASEGKLHGILLRYFNPIGAHPSALIGELPRGVPNNLVPFITQTAIGKRESLSIFGNDYPTEDGTCLRDYIDIVDLAKAHVYAVRRMLDEQMKAPCEVFNIGTGRPVSVLELVNAFEKVNGLKLNWKFAPRRAGDVTAIWADPTLANKELGWKAERSVEETLAAAWAWEKRLAGK